jgi:dihydrofolate synthase/folylpolyglutamate synthase
MSSPQPAHEAVFDWLHGLAQFGIKFGLENTLAITAALDRPERAFHSIHVAGTNGKGSVTAMLDAALRAAGVRTGRYTSPHLLDLSERFVIDGTPVSQVELGDAVATVRAAVERLRGAGVLDVHPTFFEVTTAVAFELFRRRAVDVAVCEVGLGGRLDATNVLSPMACAITSIGFDHQQYLGRTLADIAAEKAGIIKPSTPVVLGPVAVDAADVISRRAKELSAPLLRALDDISLGNFTEFPDGRQQFSLRTPSHDYQTLTLALAGRHQIQNAIIAVRLLEQLTAAGFRVAPGAIVSGLAHVQWEGRLQRIRVDEDHEVLLDAAHNEQGAAALADYLAVHPPARPLVFAVMRDKDIEPILRRLAPRVSSIVLTKASNPRSADPSDVAALIERVAPHLRVRVAGSPLLALTQAWEESPLVLVSGSIFLLADVMRGLGRS